MLYWEFYHKEERLTTPRVVLTIHNMENSGECRDEEFNATGYDGSVFLQIDKALDERTIGHNPERLSLMKGGVTYSNKVSTVSPSYARETTHHGAAGVLVVRRDSGPGRPARRQAKTQQASRRV